MLILDGEWETKGDVMTYIFYDIWLNARLKCKQHDMYDRHYTRITVVFLEFLLWFFER